MENKINIAELLKDCPKGMELDCAMYDNVQFDIVQDGNAFPIKINTPEGRISLSKYGCCSLNPQSKSVIYPKGKTTWEGFVPPFKFKDGDVITCTNSACSFVAIFKELNTDATFRRYVSLTLDDVQQFWTKVSFSDFCNPRHATEEEKQKLFKAIKDNGYKWNAETKTLENLIEPIFTVGDRIKHKTRISQEDIVTEIKDTHYILNEESALPFAFQDDYELVPDKFDIDSLQPFDKVLSRDNDSQKWGAELFSFYDNESTDYRFQLIGAVCARYCIPFEGNEHLLGKTEDCNDFYKTWE